jgi:peptide/nickel transport system substrate-binding protein
VCASPRRRKFTFEEVLLKFHARTKASMGGALAGIDAPDDRTVVFRFKQPYAPLLLQLDATEAPIVARHVYQGGDPQTNPANVNPVGTGPFKAVSYRKGAEIRLARNPAYFKQGLPYLDEIVMRVIPDAAQVLALERRGRFPVKCPARIRAVSRPILGSAWRRRLTTRAGRTAS